MTMIDASSLIFSLGQLGQVSAGAQAASSASLVEALLTQNTSELGGISLTDPSSVKDFSSLLKSMLFVKLKVKDVSGEELEQLMLKVSEKDSQASLEELLSALLCAVLTQLNSDENLMLKVKALVTGARSGSSDDDNTLKQKIIEILSNLKQDSNIVDRLLDKLAGDAKTAEIVVQQRGFWKEFLAQFVMLQLKAKVTTSKEGAGGAVQETTPAVTKSAPQQTTVSDEVSLVDKLLPLVEESSKGQAIEALGEQKAYGLNQEGMLFKIKAEIPQKAQESQNLELKYMTLPKPESVIKELNLAMGTAKENRTNGQMQFMTSDSAQLFIKNLEGNPDTVEKAQPNPAEAIKPQEMVEQFVQKLQTILKESSQEAYIELKPEHLGRAFIKVSLEDGKVSVRIEVSNIVVKETLESNFSMLKDSLRDKGFSMDRFTVSVNADARGNSHQLRDQFVQPDVGTTGWFEEVESERELTEVSGVSVIPEANYYLEHALVNYLV